MRKTYWVSVGGRVIIKDIRVRIGQQRMESLYRKEDMLAWSSDMEEPHRWMDHIPQQAVYWELLGFRRGPGGSRTNWRGILDRRGTKIGLTWEETETAALKRQQ